MHFSCDSQLLDNKTIRVSLSLAKFELATEIQLILWSRFFARRLVQKVCRVCQMWNGKRNINQFRRIKTKLNADMMQFRIVLLFDCI